MKVAAHTLTGQSAGDTAAPQLNAHRQIHAVAQPMRYLLEMALDKDIFV